MIKLLKLDETRLLEYDEQTRTGREIDISSLPNDRAFLEKEISRHEGILKDDKQLLAWAREFYKYHSGLVQLKEQLEKCKVLLEAKEALDGN